MPLRRPHADRRRGDLSLRARPTSTSRPAASRPSGRTSRSTGAPPGAISRRSSSTSSSGDWQESDEVLAGILTDFGSRTGAGHLRRPRRVRRRDDRPDPAAARRGNLSAARTCAPGTRSGATVRAHIVVENNYVDVAATASIRDQALGDSRRRTVFARLSAPRRRRGDQRALPRRRSATSTACDTRSSSTTGRCPGC